MTGGEGSQLERLQTRARTYSEPDEWDPTKRGVLFSEIPSPELLAPIDGSEREDILNEPTSVDCEGATCSLDWSIEEREVYDVDVLDPNVGRFEAQSLLTNQAPPFGGVPQ